MEKDKFEKLKAAKDKFKRAEEARRAAVNAQIDTQVERSNAKEELDAAINEWMSS